MIFVKRFLHSNKIVDPTVKWDTFQIINQIKILILTIWEKKNIAKDAHSFQDWITTSKHSRGSIGCITIKLMPRNEARRFRDCVELAEIYVHSACV